MKHWLQLGMGTMLGLLLAACPPQQQVRGDGDQAEEPPVTSVAGMTAAIQEIDAARGTPEEGQLLARYEKAYKTDPQNPFRRFLWAYALEDRNQAWQELVKVTKLNAKFFWAYLGMGIILDDWGVYDQSERNFQRALTLAPKVAIGHARFGRMLLHKGDHEQALAKLQKAVELAPQQTPFKLDLARALAAAGKLDRAVSTYRAVIAAEPEAFAPRSELARLLARQGDKAAAAEAYAEAVARDPQAYEERFARAELLVELDRDEEAVAAYRQACELRPDAGACWQALAELGEELGRQALQVEAYEQVVRIDPENLKARAFLGPVYLEQGAIEQALPAYQRVLAERPEDVDALWGLARIYKRGEQWAQALEFTQRVLEQQPEHSGAQKAREELFARFHILSEPIGGKSPEAVFGANRRQIASVYKQRLEQRPGMRGDLLFKVAVDDAGRVGEVTVEKDTVGDPVLELCAVWNLKRSRFPEGFGATYDFALTLKPGAG